METSGDLDGVEGQDEGALEASVQGINERYAPW